LASAHAGINSHVAGTITVAIHALELVVVGIGLLLWALTAIARRI